MMTPRFTLACSAGLLTCLPLTLRAQQAATVVTPVAAPAPALPADAFPVTLAQQTRDNPDGHTIYTIRATTADAKLTGQKIRFLIHATSSGGTSDRQLTVNTGKYKTVPQMEAVIADIFRRFFDGGTTAVGKEIGKIGDVRYGGEIRFTAESADSLRYDIVKPEGPASGGGHFDRTQAQAFAAMLGRVP